MPKLITIIDAIIRTNAELVHKRLITDQDEAERLGVKVGDHVIEYVRRPYVLPSWLNEND